MKRHHLAWLAVAVLLAGCGPETELDLDLRAVAITVPRLATPAVELVPAAPAPPPVALPLPPPLGPLPSLPVPDVSAPSAPPPSAAPVAACPEADQFAVPEKPATVVLDAAPAPDRYVQSATGEFSTFDGDGSLAGPVDVTVVRLPSATSAVGQRVDTYQVQRTDAAGGTTVERYQLVHPSDSPAATAPGIYLVGLAWKDSARGELTFEPVGAGIYVLPNPVVLTTTDPQYAGTATDPATLTTLTVTRNVTGKKRVDVCGALVDAYTVTLSGTLTTSDVQYQVSWTQQLATAYGGAVVEDLLSLTTADATLTYTRGLRSTRLPKDVS